MQALGKISAIAQKFAGRGVDYCIVYITEAHPTDGWMNQYAPPQFAGVAYARTLEDRLAAARRFVDKLDLRAPCLVDAMSDQVENAYEARPERLYVVQGGNVLWRCGPGPFEYDPSGLATFLDKLTATGA